MLHTVKITLHLILWQHVCIDPKNRISSSFTGRNVLTLILSLKKCWSKRGGGSSGLTNSLDSHQLTEENYNKRDNKLAQRLNITLNLGSLPC